MWPALEDRPDPLDALNIVASVFGCNGSSRSGMVTAGQLMWRDCTEANDARVGRGGPLRLFLVRRRVAVVPRKGSHGGHVDVGGTRSRRGGPLGLRHAA